MLIQILFAIKSFDIFEECSQAIIFKGSIVVKLNNLRTTYWWFSKLMLVVLGAILLE